MQPFCLSVTLLLSLLFTASTYADRQVKITVISGITDQQVFQRNADNTARIIIKGTTALPQGAVLQFRIQRRAQMVKGFDWTSVPVDANYRWQLSINTLPIGGPYSFKFRLWDSAQELDAINIDNILVGDLWVLCGQSNMDGCGDLAESETPSEMVHSFSLANTWQTAEDPITYCYESYYPVYLTSYVSPTVRRPISYKPRGTWPDWKPESNLGAGLGIPFAKQFLNTPEFPLA
jgi:sialate O-acetylesterase